MKQKTLHNYAELIVRMGVNVTPGTPVEIRAELDQPEFVRMVAEECYKAGASDVRVEWSYQPLQKVHVAGRSLKTLSTVKAWEKLKIRTQVKELPAMIYLTSEDPDGLDGIDFQKYMKAAQKRSRIIKPIRDLAENKYRWCIAAVPGKGWAKKVFPGLSPAAAEEQLWKAILSCSRAPEGSQPMEEWKKHNENLRRRCAYLNSLGLDRLEYSASNGTHLTVGLIPEALFMGGEEKVQGADVWYNPNIPSEEIFVSPMRGRAEGVVYSTKPLSYNGVLIENFSVTFKDGRAVDVKAEKNEELLRKLISFDEGAAYLGECALVPKESPISRSGILFYNTLFDENASCHLALGMGFENVLVGYENMTLDEAHQKGINDSNIHEDFMIGTEDLSIVGVGRDGKRTQIFKDGTWAF